VVYYQYDKSWNYKILNRNDKSFAIPMSRIVKIQPRRRQSETEVKETTEYLTQVAVSAVDRVGNESEVVFRMTP
jgi:hypothetical protein